MRFILLVFVIAGGLLSGYGTLQVNPITKETRQVLPAADPGKTVTVPKGIVWYDTSPHVPPMHGLRFPPGTYVLEAEDADYWYLRAATSMGKAQRRS